MIDEINRSNPHGPRSPSDHSAARSLHTHEEYRYVLTSRRITFVLRLYFFDETNFGVFFNEAKGGNLQKRNALFLEIDQFYQTAQKRG